MTDGASYTANIAQGSFFTVWGSNLAPSSIGLTNFPRPTSVGGVKVTFTPAAGGAGTDTYLIYVGTGQINALLPSTVPVGNYNVTVTNGTVSNQVSDPGGGHQTRPVHAGSERHRSGRGV